MRAVQFALSATLVLGCSSSSFDRQSSSSGGTAGVGGSAGAAGSSGSAQGGSGASSSGGNGGTNGGAAGSSQGGTSGSSNGGSSGSTSQGGSSGQSSGGSGADAGAAGSGGAGGSGAAGAAGGTAGAAGSTTGGTGGSPGCPTPCDDGVACNGVETCQGTTCVPGTPPDCSPPSEFCTSTCEEDGSGGHVCVVTAKDGDNDQHGDIRCTQDPSADDCDDGKDFVKPGAPELCDGLDNDCDNQADLDDGLTLGGTPTPLQGAFSAESVDLIWADGINRYALVWGGTGSEAPIRFTLLNQDGTRDGSIVELTPGHIGVDARPAVAYDGVSFMVAWVSDTTVLSYALIRSGAVFGSVQNLTRSGNIGGPDIIARPSGGFLLVWADTDTSYRARAQVIHHDGQLSGSELDLGQADFNRPPTVGTRLGNGQDLVVWDRTGVTYNLVNGSSALGGGVLDGSGDRPIAIGLDASDGALVAWKNGAATRIAYVDDTGTPGCGGSDLAGLGEPNSVVAGPGSETLLVTHSGGTLQLTRVNAAACTQIGSSLPISTGSLASFMFEATFARGNNGYLAVWPDNFNALQTRSLGPRLCD